jgi:hypothetical protein
MLKKNYADKYRVTFRQGFEFLESFELDLQYFILLTIPEMMALVIFHLALINHLRRGIEFLFLLECKLFFFPIYGELDFSFSDINVCIGGAQKGSPEDE